MSFEQFTIQVTTGSVGLTEANAPVEVIPPRAAPRQVRATYDAAGGREEMANYWAHADHLDADSANSHSVRKSLVSRQRYELGNNGYADGIAQTYATDLVGVGPALRMQTGSKSFNTHVETTFYLWCQAVQWRRKLWTMAHAKGSDGEGIGVMRRNPRIKHPIPLDVVLYETDQCHTPMLPYGEPGYIDGIKFDEFGNPLWYDLLKEHPGSANRMQFTLEPEHVSAEFVLHWFKMRRPGQHRGVPECASTLNLGAAARRHRSAVLAAAETAAAHALVIKTQNSPDITPLALTPFTTESIEHNMMTALPKGWEAYQLQSNNPNSTYAEFHKSNLNEQARPKNMPYNKAACDSSSYNYASGRLDHQTYYAALDVDREDCNDTVLEPLFSLWFDMAIRRFGWLGGNPDIVGRQARIHTWDWPKHRVADVQAEASANETKLKSGQVFPHRLMADGGLDFDDEVEKAALTFGVDEAVVRQRLFDVLLPPPKVPAAPAGEAAQGAVAAVLNRLNGSADKLLVQGGHHG
jgi:capsid protein